MSRSVGNLPVRVESSSAKGVPAEAALGAELFQDVLKGAGDLSRAP